jgi:His/Glu/Gln/Arg/opine family amino acid ABC transporter permease subunit
MGEFSLDFAPVWANLPKLLAGFGVSALVAIIAMAIALLGGIGVAILTTSRWRTVRWLAFVYIQVFRGVALYVLIIWVYFGLAISMQVAFAPIPAGIVSLALLNSAYLADIVRTGLQRLDRGQREAGDALGLDRGTTMLYVELPQALRAMVPAIGNQFTDILKDTSLLAMIAVPELMYTSQRLAQTSFSPFEFYSFAAVLYIVAVALITWGVRHLERSGRIRVPPVEPVALDQVTETPLPAPAGATVGK